jgi:hypothetical protein
MLSKSGIKYTSALALVSMLALPSANAGLKQLEIKGKVAAAGHTVDFGKQTDSGIVMDGDLDFKMKFSQDVTARLDLEFDNQLAGAAAGGAGNRFDIGVDQAFFKMNDFLFRNFSLSIGKQNLNVSLRDNNSNSWAFSDPVSVIGAYSTRDMDIKVYFAKLNEDALGTAGVVAGTMASNDKDADLTGVTGEYWLNDDSLVLAYLNYKSDKNVGASNLVHYGVGLDYFIGEALEVYGEIAGQSIDGGTPATDGTAFQLTLGGEYSFSDFDMKPTVGLEYYLQSGSDVGDPAWQSVAGGLSSADSDSLFVEKSGASARDINPGVGAFSKGGGTDGYSVLRLNGSISPSKATKVGLGIHFFTNETAAVADDNVGTEVDLYASWKYSQDVSFTAGAYLVSDYNPTGAAAGTDDVTGISLATALTF